VRMNVGPFCAFSGAQSEGHRLRHLRAHAYDLLPLPTTSIHGSNVTLKDACPLSDIVSSLKTNFPLAQHGPWGSAA